MTLVVDAAVVGAALIEQGPEGAWARNLLPSEALAAPHLMLVETANSLRVAVFAGTLSLDSASQAHTELLSLRFQFYSYQPFAARVWELRNSLTAYDAWYVALAEELGATLATLDQRMLRTSGPRCRFTTFTS